MKKKHYQQPSVHTVELRQQHHLLAESNEVYRTTGEEQLQYGGEGDYEDR